MQSKEVEIGAIGSDTHTRHPNVGRSWKAWNNAFNFPNASSASSASSGLLAFFFFLHGEEASSALHRSIRRLLGLPISSFASAPQLASLLHPPLSFSLPSKSLFH